MPIPVNAPPESLAGDLTMSLWRERATLRFLARRKAWEPSIDDCRGLAGRLVEYLKGRGVLRVIRQGAGEQHSIGPIAPMRAAPPMREAVPVPAVRGWAVCRMQGGGTQHAVFEMASRQTALDARLLLQEAMSCRHQNRG
jgi:hypothetical protein